MAPLENGSGSVKNPGPQQPRSRCLRRLRITAPKVNFPETPLVLAGALGGPFCIFLLTPLRNALTLASQDSESSAPAIYGRVFGNGFFGGWTGGLAAVPASCPQFCIMGPLFHSLSEAFGSPVVATVISAAAETAISYGSQTLNAQMAYNQEVLSEYGTPVPLANSLIPFGPGVSVHILRNVVALSGIRVFSGPCRRGLVWFIRSTFGRCLPPNLIAGSFQFLGDLVASICAAIFSAPLHQTYNFAITSATYAAGGLADNAREITGFLENQYLVHGEDGGVTGISPTLARDLFMRCMYVAVLYSIFGSIERIAVAVAERKRVKAPCQWEEVSTLQPPH